MRAPRIDDAALVAARQAGLRVGGSSTVVASRCGTWYYDRERRKGRFERLDVNQERKVTIGEVESGILVYTGSKEKRSDSV